MSPNAELPVGLAGLRYPITQVSLAVRDLDATMAAYHRAFGWAPWQVFDHVPPVHHRTELRGQPVHYSLRGAEVYVGSLNFELLQPLEGPNLWSEFMDRRGEGVASIATMFHRARGRRRGQGRLQGALRHRRQHEGRHRRPHRVLLPRHRGASSAASSSRAAVTPSTSSSRPRSIPIRARSPVRSPVSGITYPITQISVTVRDLEPRMKRLSRGVRLGTLEGLRGRRHDDHARLRVDGQAGRLPTCAGPRRWSAT